MKSESIQLNEEQKAAVKALAQLCVVPGAVIDTKALAGVLAMEMAQLAIVETRGNQTRAADMLKLNRGTFRTKMRQLNFKKQGNY